MHALGWSRRKGTPRDAPPNLCPACRVPQCQGTTSVLKSVKLNSPETTTGASDRWQRDLAIILQRYGFYGLQPKDGNSITPRLAIEQQPSESNSSAPNACRAVFAFSPGWDLPGISWKAEPAGQILYRPGRWWPGSRAPVYRALLPHGSFSGPALTPVWTSAEGRTVIGWWNYRGKRQLLVGLDIVEEIVRYTHGDPHKVTLCVDKTLWGYGNERSAFLYEDHVVSGFEMIPWADRLGYLIATFLSHCSCLPLISTLPNGATGAVLLTGDDDQAFLEKYEQQVRLLDGFPMTYFLLPNTRHTSETLAQMPTSIELGVHIDALEQPEQYESRCSEQTDAVRRLIGRPAKSIRNHGHLSRGYWEHLSTWEKCGFSIDLNIRGLDGTCPTGSYLPFRVRRPDGSWSNHISLFSTFSDSMYFVQKWPEKQQIRCITRLANQIERAFPGVIVFNFHPQNVSEGHRVLRAAMDIGRRSRWIALGAESYVGWLERLTSIEIVCRSEDRLLLKSPDRVSDLALVWPSRQPGRKQLLQQWDGELELSIPHEARSFSGLLYDC